MFTVYDQNEDIKAGRNKETVINLVKALENYYAKGEGEAPEVKACLIIVE